MLASFPASMLNQKPSDLGILNQFKLDPSRSSARGTASEIHRAVPVREARAQTQYPVGRRRRNNHALMGLSGSRIERDFRDNGLPNVRARSFKCLQIKISR